MMHSNFDPDFTLPSPPVDFVERGCQNWPTCGCLDHCGIRTAERRVNVMAITMIIVIGLAISGAFWLGRVW